MLCLSDNQSHKTNLLPPPLGPWLVTEVVIHSPHTKFP